MYTKLSAGAAGYDVLVPTSYMVKTLAREERIQPLDHSKIPNLTHVDPDYLKRSLDPEMKYSVPYMMAPTCIAWLKSKVANPEPSYRMFGRSDLKGRMTLLDDFRGHDGAVHERRADPGAGTLADNEDFLEFDLRTGFAFELLDLDDVVGSNLILLPAGLDDCEHCFSFHVLTASAKPLHGLATGGLLVQSVGLKRSGLRR